MTTTIIVCDTCRWLPDERRRASDGLTGGEILAGQVEQEAADIDGVTVRRHSCLNGCKRHCNAAVVAPGKTAYYLSEFTPDGEAAAAIVAFAALHHRAADGTVPKPLRPEGVAGHLVGRIPALE